LFLGIPTTIINALLLSLGLKILYRDDSYLWIYSFILATILSATDAFSSVQMVKDVGMNSKFISLLKGETLLNNAVAYSMLTAAVKYQSGEYSEWWQLVLAFISLNLVSVLLGLLIGFLSSFILKKMFNDYI
jgi:NhaP-type Na+/H+ or K+/H+ antiporter